MGDYRAIFTVSEVIRYLDISKNKVVSFDVKVLPNSEAFKEDRDKSFLDINKYHIVGISLSVSLGSGVYIPLENKGGKSVRDKYKMMSFLKEFLFENESLIKVCHDISLKSSLLYGFGIVLQEPVFDTMLGAMLTFKRYGEFRTLEECSLNNLMRDIFKENTFRFNSLDEESYFNNFKPYNIDYIKYACLECNLVLKLYRWCLRWFDIYIKEHRVLCERVESPAAIYTGIMKRCGIKIDKNLLDRLNREACFEMESIRREILSFAKRDVNLGCSLNTKDFKDFIFKDLNLPVLKRCETGGGASLDYESLLLLKRWCEKNSKDKVRLIDSIRKYRRICKLKSTYIEPFYRYLNLETNKIYTDFLSMGTETGRFISKNPNLQNLPRGDNDHLGIRKLFIPSKNYVFLDFDFSQIELRVGAYYCKDRKMIKAFLEDFDIHAMTTSIIYNISLEEALDKSNKDYKKRRTIAKNCNFGVFFGLYKKGLQRNLFYKGGVDIEEEGCEKIINSIKNGYPNLSTWQRDAIHFAENRGYASSRAGRRRYLKDIESRDLNKRSASRRCALNTPIQGTAADIIKISMARILRGLKDRDYIKPVLQIHDELLFEVLEDNLDEAIDFIKSSMERAPFKDFNIPIRVCYSIGHNFSEV